MTFIPVLAVGIVMNLIAILFVVVSIVLILLILIQKGRGGGLSGAFGGGMASGLLGSKTGDFLTWATITVVAVFLVLAVVLAKFYRPAISEYGGAQPQVSQPVPDGTTAQPAPQMPAPSEQPGGTDTGAAAPEGQPPAAQPGGATAPSPETGPAGGQPQE